MSGDLVAAPTLADWGLIDEITPRAALDDAAIAMAEKYAALPPIAVQMIKRSVNALSGALDAAVMHADTDQWLLGMRTDDFAEGIAAFQEKRAGRFTGR
jgi:enoyl-CoA hydratase/carnithine racemase